MSQMSETLTKQLSHSLPNRAWDVIWLMFFNYSRLLKQFFVQNERLLFVFFFLIIFFDSRKFKTKTWKYVRNSLILLNVSVINFNKVWRT